MTIKSQTSQSELQPVKGSAMLLAILALSLGLRLLFITQQSYWVDELTTVFAIELPWKEMLSELLFGYETHPILFQCLTKLWAELFGYTKFALRLFPCVLGTLFVYYSYRLAKELAPSLVAQMAAVLAAISPYAIYYSQEVRSYILFGLLTTTSYYYFLIFLREGKSTAYFSWLISSVLAFYAHVYGAFILIAQAAQLFVHLKHSDYTRESLTNMFLGFVIISTSFLPWVLFMVSYKLQLVSNMTASGWVKSFSPGFIAYAFYALFFGYSLGPSVEELHILAGLREVFQQYGLITTTAVLSPIIPFFMGLLNLRSNKAAASFILLGLLVPLVLALGISVVTPLTFRARYIIMVLPFLFILTASGIWRICGKARYVWIILPLFFFLGLSDYNYYTNPKYWREDYEKTAEYIQTREDLPVLAGYHNRAFFKKLAPNLTISSINSKELDSIDSGESVWIIWNRPWMYDSEGLLREKVSKGFHVLSQKNLPGFYLQEVQKN